MPTATRRCLVNAPKTPSASWRRRVRLLRRWQPAAWRCSRPRCGPALGPPAVDRITGSRLHNLKELRPGSAGKTEIRILFIFDPQRRAVLLVAGEKAGNWTRWYRDAIKLAEDRYARYLATPPEEIQ